MATMQCAERAYTTKRYTDELGRLTIEHVTVDEADRTPGATPHSYLVICGRSRHPKLEVRTLDSRTPAGKGDSIIGRVTGRWEGSTL